MNVNCRDKMTMVINFYIRFENRIFVTFFLFAPQKTEFDSIHWNSIEYKKCSSASHIHSPFQDTHYFSYHFIKFIIYHFNIIYLECFFHFFIEAETKKWIYKCRVYNDAQTTERVTLPKKEWKKKTNQNNK